ncbi:PDZ domain-containing protein [Halobacillus litoralis]|uniref:PDZ domain-containing protein n=1 Tax=Halobacillus litoralis TaxID=45668 RepID=UPI001CFEDA48|nr:PDZ domain-containing protein [Halobacillus litoralis]
MEFIEGIGRMFSLPFLYIAVGMVVWLSAKRIKQERSAFGTRVFDRFSEWKGTWSTALSSGILLSVAGVAGGIVLSFPLLILIAGVLLLVSLTGRLTWHSSVYTLGITALFLLVLPFLPGEWQDYSWIETLQETPLTGITVLMSVLLFTESLLLLKTTPSDTFPERTKGRRGMWIGQHRGRRLAIVPFFALIPGGAVEPFASWWPLISIGGESFGIVLVPFVLGMEWLVRGQSPETASKTIGRHTFLAAVLILMLTIGSFFFEPLALAVVAVGIIARELIYTGHRARENKTPFFSSHPQGVRILGVIPNSSAAQMGLIPGELIMRVNNIPVRSESQFYEALQNTGAFAKIEVCDERGENRYVQRALYESDHYELGLVFVEPPTHETSVGFF